jgi:hypothetical protein
MPRPAPFLPGRPPRPADARMFMHRLLFYRSPLLPHSARSAELTEPPLSSRPAGAGALESEAAGGVKESAGEPARRRPRRRPGHPAVVMAGLADQQHPSRLVGGRDRHRRHEQQLMPDDGAQPGDVRSDTHVGNPPVRSGRPRPERTGILPWPMSRCRAATGPTRYLSMHVAEYLLALPRSCRRPPHSIFYRSDRKSDRRLGPACSRVSEELGRTRITRIWMARR